MDFHSPPLDAHEHFPASEMWKYDRALSNGEASGNLFIAFNNSTLLAEVYYTDGANEKDSECKESKINI